MTITVRSYSELRRFETIKERFDYLKLSGRVGANTFGSERYLNQDFYRSKAWRRIRQHVIARDLGCDLGVPDYEIHDAVYVHHLNPMIPDDIIGGSEDILNPEFLISVSMRTHNAIHYGEESQLPKDYVPRQPGDTKLW